MPRTSNSKKTVAKKKVTTSVKPKTAAKTTRDNHSLSTPSPVFNQTKNFSPKLPNLNNFLNFNNLFKKFKNIKNIRPTRNTYLVLAGLIILALVLYKKSWFIAASVNGQPISNIELLAKINSQYRTQTINDMVNEKVILDEAKKKGIIVKNSDIQAQIIKYEEGVGGKETFESMLAQQGQTRQGLESQIKLQLIIEKMFESEASPSSDEVQKFINQNKDQMSSTDSANQEKEATDALKQQKIRQLFQTKFQELKNSANIQIF